MWVAPEAGIDRLYWCMPTQNNSAMRIFQQSYEHYINTKYVHFNTCHVLISTNHEHKTQHIQYYSQHNA